MFRGAGLSDEEFRHHDPTTAYAGRVLEKADRAAAAVTHNISLAEAARRLEAGEASP